jgi:hypothetical protein
MWLVKRMTSLLQQNDIRLLEPQDSMALAQ